MASVINTNTLSMVTQQNLNQSQNALNTSMERLSSGMRINSAKDDAAGQAIANRMDSQITGLSQAQRNANDGISVAQTAEGALNQVNDNLQRVRELTVQAQNGTNNADDLSSIQDEITMRLDEINRISEQTSFNGIDILQEDNSLSIQVGANDGETISIDLKEINTGTLSLSNFNVDGNSEIDNTAATKTDLDKLVSTSSEWAESSGTYTNTVQNEFVNATDALGKLSQGDTVVVDDGTVTTYTFDESGNNFSFSQSIDAASNSVADGDALAASIKSSIGSGEKSGLTYEVNGAQTGINVDSAGNLTAENGDKLYFEGAILTATPTSSSPVQATEDDLYEQLVSQTGAKLTSGDVTYETTAAHVDTTTAGTVSVTGNTLSLEEMKTKIEDNTGGSTDVNYGAAIGSVTTGSISLDEKGVSTSDYVASDGSFTTNSNTISTYQINSDDSVAQVSGSQPGATAYINTDGDVTTEATSKGSATSDPLEALDSALKQVDSMRSDLGAVQNRFDSAITNLATTETNLASAQSRIQDADYAEEVSSMTTAQILQQAGTSMLTQANQVPQNVLSLLG